MASAKEDHHLPNADPLAHAVKAFIDVLELQPVGEVSQRNW